MAINFRPELYGPETAPEPRPGEGYDEPPSCVTCREYVADDDLVFCEICSDSLHGDCALPLEEDTFICRRCSAYRETD